MSTKAYHEGHKEEDRTRGKAYYATHKEERKAYRDAHREDRKSYHTSYYASHKEKFAKSRRVQNYGVDGLGLLVAQNGRCGICGKNICVGTTLTTLMPAPKIAHLDHCHETKVVRGWLCDKCNVGLGHFRDSIINLHKAIAYLEQFEIFK